MAAKAFCTDASDDVARCHRRYRFFVFWHWFVDCQWFLSVPAVFLSFVSPIARFRITSDSSMCPARKRKRDRCITVSHTVVARKSSMRTKSTEPADREVKNVAYADLVIFPHWSTCVSVNYLSGWATSRSPLR